MLTYILIGINVVVSLGALLGRRERHRARRQQHAAQDGAVSGPRSPTASTGGSSPAASCTPGPSPALQHVRRSMSSGRCWSPRSARLRFPPIYFVSLLAGSFGALLLEPTRSRSGLGRDLRADGGGVLVMRNRGHQRHGERARVLHRSQPGASRSRPDISIGGHIGGLIGGGVAAVVMFELAGPGAGAGGRARGRMRGPWLPWPWPARSRFRLPA